MGEVVLLTGATGFIGSALLRLAAAGEWGSRFHFVTLGSRPIKGFDFADDRRGPDGLYGFTAVDLIAAGVGHIDYLIHLGAFIPKTSDEADDVRRIIPNIANLSRLVENLPAAPKRLVFASSIDVYAPAASPVSEDAMCAPATLYGHSKLIGERIIEVLAEQADRLFGEAQIVRIGHTYGPGEAHFRKFIPQAIRQLSAGKNLAFSATGHEHRSFIYIDDCCRLLIEALDTEGGTGPINIAAERAYTLREVVHSLSEIYWRATDQRVYATWREGEGPMFEVIPDVGRMQKSLGTPVISLEQGLQHEFDSMTAPVL